MKINFLTVILGFIAITFITSSCLNDNDTVYETSQNASITAFSISENIETSVKTTNSKGEDTTIIVTVNGENYNFSIYQNSNNGYRQITNKDSLPVGTDISKLVVNISADTPYIFFKNSADKDSLWQSTDSLDFTSPKLFRVLSTASTWGPYYRISVNVHKQVPDSLQWLQVSKSFINNTFSKQKAIYLNNRIYVIGVQGENTVITFTSTTSLGWDDVKVINIPGVDYSSAMAWNGKIYILADNTLYSSSDEGATWKESAKEIKKLLANYNSSSENKIYGINSNNQFIESSDGENWSASNSVPDEFPKSNISYYSYPLVFNNSLYESVVLGNNELTETGDTTIVVWNKLSNANDWTPYTYNNSKNYLPKLANVTMIGYNNGLYAFGGEGKKNKEVINPFSAIFTSNNYGVDWIRQTSMVMFPNEFQNYYELDNNYSCVVDENNFIWIIWSKNGGVWKGRVNKLGFEQKK